MKYIALGSSFGLGTDECDGVGVLSLSHFAYNDGGFVDLYVGSVEGMREAYLYWKSLLLCGDFPLQLEDVSGCCYERGWYTLTLSI